MMNIFIFLFSFFPVLLEVVDPEYLKHGVTTEKDFEEANNDFEEDFALMTDKPKKKETKVSLPKSKKTKVSIEADEISEDDEQGSEQLEEDNEKLEESEEVDEESENSDASEEFDDLELNSNNEDDETNDKSEEFEDDDIGSDENDSEDDEDIEFEAINNKNKSKKRKLKEAVVPNKKKKKMPLPDVSNSASDESDGNDDFDAVDTNEIDPEDEGLSDDEDGSDNEDSEEKDVHKGAAKQFPDGTWEDIYGRLRGKDGSIITKKSESKYVPPALRGKETDKKRSEQLSRLRKQLKGLINRLAESNMHSIASQIEDLYMNNSRNDMNDTLTNLMMESLVAEVRTPERLMIEHVVLLIVLHANVGTEVGAHFLQHVAKQFDENFNSDQEVENKTLDNLVCIIAQLYNFKLFDSRLVYEVLQKLANNFKEKDVECILHILRSIGFSLRKDDPLALKNLILELQNKANNISEKEKDNSRVKFMLDILLAIKNNNVSKIPNYDVSYSEHLKKVMKGFIRKGNYVTELNISLEDLLKADQRGRWWVVGSAWTGTTESENQTNVEKPEKSQGFSSKLLELARKQRMNTDVRRNIFCIIMSAEDYMDAFERLLKLGLKNTQEREIINVILHCCLQEKEYNPYYGHLTQRFCDLDRKYQLTIKYSIWDKIKTIGDHSGSQLSNLAKLLIHLFIEKGLPISTLKVMQFSELDKMTLRFTRQILLGILLHKDVEASLSVFARVSQSEKLKLFRESLRLFIHHFLLRNLKTDKVPEDQKTLLESRAKMVERVLASKEVRVS
uniref:Nucleolar MIF4G domain-containing protein 1 homolog n=1 Tax=Diabrotica virgifera virgifera TaxID=50390 RepID=A0A6P7FR44_DIAVI